MYWATGMPGWARFGTFPGPGMGVPAYGAGMTRSEEIEVLKEQAEYFKANLDDIEKRLQAMESEDE